MAVLPISEDHERGHNFILVLIGFASLVAALVLSEVFVRYIDGFQILRLHLVSAADPANNRWTNAISPSVTDAVEAMAVPADVSKKWFSETPEVAKRPTNLQLDKLYQDYAANPASLKLDPTYQYNRYWLESSCKNAYRQAITQAPEGKLWVYAPTEKSTLPPYRLFRNVQLASALSTNNFGFRGPDIPLHKPPKTIRIAFLGSSTTIDPYDNNPSYPEFVGFWLNRWAAENKIDVKFDVINAGRTGFSASEIAATFEQEVIPLHPDIVLYYEGANGFWPPGMIKLDDSKAAKPVLPKSQSEAEAISLRRSRFPFANYSAIARRLSFAFDQSAPSGEEVAHPPYKIIWPDGVDEHDPNIAATNLPFNLHLTLEKIGLIHREAKSIGAEMVLSTLYQMVFDGMKLDPVANWGLLWTLNTVYWPVSYRDMARLNDFQCLVFKRLTQSDGIPVIDYAKKISR